MSAILRGSYTLSRIRAMLTSSRGSFLPWHSKSTALAMYWLMPGNFSSSVLVEGNWQPNSTRIPHLAQTSDAVNRQLSCFSSRYMNLLAVFQI